MPANATNTSSLPVAFWIYGGGFFAGNTASYPMYDWVAQNPGIVAVSAAYRLASLGFLAGPGIAADGDYNIGLLDQRAAMEWVQRHIRAFGGNPDEVTIIGESAGAAAVVMQITGYGGEMKRVLHHKARMPIQWFRQPDCAFQARRRRIHWVWTGRLRSEQRYRSHLRYALLSSV